MALVDQIEITGVFTDSSVRGANLVGQVVVSAEPTSSGQAISDDYTLTVSARAGGTGTITVSTSSPNNPYNGKVVTGVPFDNVTEVLNIVPGATLVFDSDAVNTNTAIINIGDYQGLFDANGVGAGVPSDGVRHKVVNTAGSEAVDCKASLLTQSVMYKKTGDALRYVRPFADGATEKTAGGGSDRVMPYALSISAVSGVGALKVATLSVDGVALDADEVTDLTTGVTEDGVGLKAIDPPHPYAINTGPLEGLEFAIHHDCVDGDIANVLIFPSRYVQIADDVAGVEGTYGTVDVALTEVGEASGVISGGGAAYFWSRMLVPVSASNESNPYPCNIAIQGSESTQAGWEV